jgi:hypothetical protein
MLMLLVIAASVLGFVYYPSYLTPYAATSPTSMNTTATTTPITPTIELGEEPFAVGRYTPVSQTMINETLQQQQLKLVFEESATITSALYTLVQTKLVCWRLLTR